MSHQIDHTDINHILTFLRQIFIIFAQPAVTPQPSKGVLHNPTVRKYLEGLKALVALDALAVNGRRAATGFTALLSA